MEGGLGGKIENASSVKSGGASSNIKMELQVGNFGEKSTDFPRSGQLELGVFF